MAQVWDQASSGLLATSACPGWAGFVLLLCRPRRPSFVTGEAWEHGLGFALLPRHDGNLVGCPPHLISLRHYGFEAPRIIPRFQYHPKSEETTSLSKVLSTQQGGPGRPTLSFPNPSGGSVVSLPPPAGPGPGSGGRIQGSFFSGLTPSQPCPLRL